MEKKTIRAPLALAVIALFAMPLVPVSGADSPTTIYTFQTGEGAPRWTILKLEVTKPGVEPIIEFRTDEFRCPSFWYGSFMTGTPDTATSLSSFGFIYAVGRHGADAYSTTPAGTIHQDPMVADGEESCSWPELEVVEYGELPLGTVYLLHLTAGVPFEGSAKLVSPVADAFHVVGVSSGSESFFLSETRFGGGQGAVVHAPPWCGAPQELPDCDPNHVNPGGHFGAAVELDQSRTMTFKRHPWIFAMARGTVVAANASIEYPDGRVKYLREGDIARIAGLELGQRTLSIENMGAPPGRYRLNIEQSAHVGVLSYTGWHVTGADLRFPEEIS